MNDTEDQHTDTKFFLLDAYLFPICLAASWLAHQAKLQNRDRLLTAKRFPMTPDAFKRSLTPTFKLRSIWEQIQSYTAKVHLDVTQRRLLCLSIDCSDKLARQSRCQRKQQTGESLWLQLRGNELLACNANSCGASGEPQSGGHGVWNLQRSARQTLTSVQKLT